MGRKSTVDLTNEQENQVVFDYLNGDSMISISKKYTNMKHHHVDWILKKHGIEKRTNKENSKKYSCNESFFKNIDTQEKAYWLGFLYADGYVSGPNVIGMTLSSKDKSHIEKFKKAISSNHPICDYLYKGFSENYGSRIIMRSDEMKKDLESHGVVNNKTFLLDFPELKEEFIPHFIRGYFDGDGSWSFYEKENTYQFKLVGTKKLLTSILTYIGFPNAKLYKKANYEKDNYYISIGGNLQVLSIMNYLYENSTVHLDRKYQKFVKLSSSY